MEPGIFKSSVPVDRRLQSSYCLSLCSPESSDESENLWTIFWRWLRPGLSGADKPQASLRAMEVLRSILRPPSKWWDVGRHLSSLRWNTCGIEIPWFAGDFCCFFHRSLRENTLNSANTSFFSRSLTSTYKPDMLGALKRKILKYFPPPQYWSKAAKNQDSCSQNRSVF